MCCTNEVRTSQSTHVPHADLATVFLGQEQIPLVREEGKFPDLGKVFLGVERKPSVLEEGQHASDG
jgi:hypothetical protein